RIQRHTKFFLIENLEGMLGQAACSSRVNVAEQANLKRNSFVENVLREVAQFHDFAVGNGNIINQSRTMPNAVRSAILDCLPNRFLSEPLAGVNRNIEILPLNIMKRVHMFFGRKAAFFTCQIESHDSSLAKI